MTCMVCTMVSLWLADAMLLWQNRSMRALRFTRSSRASPRRRRSVSQRSSASRSSPRGRASSATASARPSAAFRESRFILPVAKRPPGSRGAAPPGGGAAAAVGASASAPDDDARENAPDDDASPPESSSRAWRASRPRSTRWFPRRSARSFDATTSNVASAASTLRTVLPMER